VGHGFDYGPPYTRRSTEPCIVRSAPGRCLRVASKSLPVALPEVISRVSPVPRSSCCASNAVTGCPAPCIFRPCRQWIVELPRRSHPSAVLALETRVAPYIRCTSAASQHSFESPRRNVFRLLPVMRSSVRTEFRIFRRRWSRFSGSPRVFAFQLPPLDESPGRPVDCIFRLLPRLNLRVAPQFRLPRLAGWWFVRLPQLPHLPAMPVGSCRVAPVPRSSGCACCGASSRLASRTLQRSRRSGPGSPPGL